MSNKTLEQLLGIKKTGDIGYELEVEFKKSLPNMNSSNGKWSIIDDPSLRTGFEFIADGAIAYDKIHEVIKEVCTYIKKYDYKFSPRTSTHIHINVLDLTEYQFLNFLLVAWYFEDFIQNGVASYRKENNFCITIKDADEFIFNTVDHLKKGGQILTIPANREYSKYSATNIATAFRIGTIEFRQFHGTLNNKLINQWIDNLWAMKEFATSFDSPEDLFHYLFAIDFSKAAQHILPFPSAFGDLTTFEYTDNNLFYISKIVDTISDKNLVKPLKKKSSAKNFIDPEEWIPETPNEMSEARVTFTREQLNRFENTDYRVRRTAPTR